MGRSRLIRGKLTIYYGNDNDFILITKVEYYGTELGIISHFPSTLVVETSLEPTFSATRAKQCFALSSLRI